MGWREQLGRVTMPDGRVLVGGSFRGVPFHTVASEVRVGRRNQINEFPQSERAPYVDDTGRLGKRYPLECYLIGEGYLTWRDKLIEAFETKGAGEMVHARYGIKKVSMDGAASFKESPAEGGIVRITVTMVEDGSNILQQATQNTVAQVETAANAADDASQACFAKEFSVDGASVLASQAINGIKGLSKTVAGLLQTARQVTSVAGLAEIVRQVGGLTRNLAELIRTPVVLVQSLRSVYAQLVQELERPLMAFDELQSVFFANERSPTVARAGSTRAFSLTNDTARFDLNRRLALTNQARVLAVAISNTDVVVTSNQAVALRDALVAQIDTEIEVNDPPLEVVKTLTAVRAAVVRDVAARAQYLQKTATYTPLTVLPAVVLAHRIYQDARRADELVERNGVSHPAFMPARPLEVLV